MAIDGKCVHKSQDNSLGVHMISAWASECGLSLGQLAVSEKSNEIPAIEKLVDSLDLKGCTLTIDAMGCQREIVKKIRKKEADYLICLKKNHKNMYKSLTGEFEDIGQRREPGTLKGHRRYDYHISVEKAHGREEKRETLLYSNGVLDKVYKGWKDIRTTVQTKSERLLLKEGKVQKQKRYYITSLEMNAENIHELVRAHWSIENNLHWQLDVAFGEDRDRKTKNAARNFSLICKMALTLLQRDKKKVSIKTKRKIAGWAQEYLEQVIMQKIFNALALLPVY